VRDTTRVASAVTAIRAGDRMDRSARPNAGAPLSPGGALAALREAIDTRSSVQISYVDNHGASSVRIVDPVSVEGGQLVAHDHRADDVRAFAVHRITTVSALDPGS